MLSKISLIKRSRGEMKDKMTVKLSGEIVWNVDLVWDKTPDK